MQYHNTQNNNAPQNSTQPIEMTQQVITLYCLCDDFLQARHWHDDPQAQMSTAEVMTVSLVAAALFDGNQEKSRRFLKEHGYIPTMLSKSRFNRRWHAIPEVLWQGMLWLLGEAAKLTNKSTDTEDVYAMDSVPIPVCDNIRIRRCCLYPCPKKAYQKTYRKQAKDKSKTKNKDKTKDKTKDKMSDPYRGYCASKRRYYYGLKGHLLVAANGQPVEFLLSPAATGDVVGFRKLDLDLPEGATVVADAAYTDYTYEDVLQDQEQVALLADRKCNSQRPHPPYLNYLCHQYRKCIETTFSTITEWFGRRLHAVTPQGFERKVFLTVLAYAILHR